MDHKYENPFNHIQSLKYHVGKLQVNIPLSHKNLYKIEYFESFILVIILIVHSFTLMRFPAPFIDEAWMASRALQFIQSGSSFGPVDHGVLDHYQAAENFYPLISSAVQSIGLLIIGAPTLFAIRLSSFIVGLVLLVLVYLLGINLKDRQLGLLAVVLTAGSWPFFVSAHLGRPDIIAAVLGYAAILLVLSDKSGKVWLSFPAGLCLALAFEIHAYSVIYIPVLFVMYVYKYKTDFIRKIDFWGFVAGGIAGLLLYLILHVFPDPPGFFQINQLVFSETHIPPLLTLDPKVLWEAVLSLISSYIGIVLIVIFGILVGLKLLKSRPAYINTLLLINISLLVGFTLLIRTKFFYYNIYLIPGLSLLLAALFVEYLNSPTRSKFIYRIRPLIVILICVAPVVPVLRSNSGGDFQRIHSHLRQVIREEETVMGNVLYWFGLQDNSYINWSNLVWYKRAYPMSNLQDAFDSLRPDVFIFDNYVNSIAFESDDKPDYFQGFRLSKTELDAFLNQYATLAAVVDEGGKDIRIYRINWPDP